MLFAATAVVAGANAVIALLARDHLRPAGARYLDFLGHDGYAQDTVADVLAAYASVTTNARAGQG